MPRTSAYCFKSSTGSGLLALPSSLTESSSSSLPELLSEMASLHSLTSYVLGGGFDTIVEGVRPCEVESKDWVVVVGAVWTV